jgi:hypothetical protein
LDDSKGLMAGLTPLSAAAIYVVLPLRNFVELLSYLPHF